MGPLFSQWSSLVDVYTVANAEVFRCRLPIIQGSSFAFIVPIIAILALPQWECPAPEVVANLTTEEVDDLWKPRMREVSANLSQLISIQRE